MKHLNLWRPFRGHPLCAISVVVFLLLCTSAGAQLYYDARGTGRTTGTVANVRVYNPTPTPMRVVLGDCFIPAASGHQGYVIPRTYPIDVGPFGSAAVALEGYCVNISQPPVPDGGSLPDVLQWVSWAAAAPLPEAGKPPGPPFVLVAAVPDDPLALTYPGTQTPMPYALDFNRYPHYGARLLLHAAYAAGEAFDQLVREGKINAASMGRSLQSLRQDLIQQSVWVQAARLEGKAYGKGHFHAQLLEEAEHQLNQPASAFAPDVRQALDRQSQDVWASVSLVGATAKLVPPSTEPRPETLRPEPTEQPIDIPTALLDRLRGTAPTQPDAIERLTPVQVFLQSHNDAPEYQALALASLEKWRAALQHLAERLDPQSPTAVRDALTAIGWVQSLPSQGISADERQHLLTTLHGKTSAAIQHTAAALRPQQPDFLAQWRALKAIADQPWYDACCRQTNPLLKLPNPMDAVRSAAPFQPANLALNGGQWKHTTPLTTPAAEPRKSFPWWIPAAGIPVVGGVVYLTTRKRDQPTPTPPPPPVAVNDAVSLNCGGQTSINPLANDSGVRIALSNISAPAGISAVAVGSAVSISAIGAGTFSVPYTITDSLGRTASATITVTVLDAGPPTITCPPATTISCDKEPDPMLTGQASATDDCPPLPNVTFSDQILDPPCTRLILRTWRATDAAGKTAACAQNIQVRDVEPPFFTVTPPNITVPLGQQNNLDLTGRAQATDACYPSANEPFFTDSELGPCGGILLRTWTATDECGNTATYGQTITVVDQTPPTITCPPPADVACGKQYDLDLTGRATATDNCPGVSTPTHTDNPPVFTGCAGVIARTWTTADSGGNTASCTQIITVNDTEPPFFTVTPPNITVPLGQQNNLDLTGRAQATDACSPPAITPVFTDDTTNLKPCGGTLLRTWTATDECGNTATYGQTITVVDQTPPTITCPPPADVACGKQYDLDLTGRATATDDCDGPLTPTYADDPPSLPGCAGVIARTWTTADSGGNTASCTQIITVNDTEPPFFTVTPPNITVPLGQQNNLDLTGRAQATDACSPPAITPVFTDDTTNLKPCGGTLLRTWTATDECGNTATYGQTITVVDQTPPTITCPPPADVACGKQYNLDLTGRATATDNCADTVFITYSDNPPAFSGCSGKIARTWTGTDPTGNASSCTQEVGVTDTDPPMLVCPPNVTVNCGQQNNFSITGQAEAKDACANGASVTHADQSTTFPTCVNSIVGQVLRIFSSADSCGNATTCLQTITIRDQTPPVITCPDVVQVQCGQQNNLNITGQPTATDNCGGPVSITHSDNNTEFANCTGVIYRTFVATDPCGNTASCTQPIAVVNVPCNFTALFGVSTPVCGRCVGFINTLVNPAGSYTYLWNTGHTTPDLNDVCPGAYTVSITNLGQECTDIYTVTVGNTPNLTLTVLQVNHPTSPSANNGRVVLQVGPAPPWSIPPFLVFVNGTPIGTANMNTFQITNMPMGEYVIWVVDQGGSGCASNEVFVFLFPGGLVGPPQLNLNAGGVPMSLPAVDGPEHPAPTPAAFWPAAPGFSLALPVGPNSQARIEYQPYLSLRPSGMPIVGAEQLSAGYRRYWPATARRSDWLLFSESLLALTHLPPPSPTATRQQLPQLIAGGGIEGALGRHIRIETGMRLSLLPTLAHHRWQWGTYLRAYLPIQGRQQTMSLMPAEPAMRR